MLKLPRRMRQAIEEIDSRRTSDRWRPRRAHFVNIFRIHEPETVWFADGKLFLDGSNGSGKSALMALLIPPVFDRNLEPQRIDTAKTRSKQFQWHLMGNLANGENERTGYVALEMISKAGKVVTFGYGAQGKFGRNEYSLWSFIIDAPLEDVQFLGVDRIPFSGRGMKTQMEKLGGKYFADGIQGREAYQSALNERLFGFKSTPEFVEYLDFLTELRKPLLGKGLSVNEVERFVKQSLPKVPPPLIQRAAASYTEIVALREKAQRELQRAKLLRAWADAQYEMSMLDTSKAFREWRSDDEKREAAEVARNRLAEDIETESKAIAKSRAESASLNPHIGEYKGKENSILKLLEAMEGIRDLQRDHDDLKKSVEERARYLISCDRRIERDEDTREKQLEAFHSAADDVDKARKALKESLGDFRDRYFKLNWPELHDEIRRVTAGDGLDFAFDIFPIEANRRSKVMENLRKLTVEIETAKTALIKIQEELQEARAKMDLAVEYRETADRNWRAAAAEYVVQTLSALNDIPGLQDIQFDVVTEDLPLDQWAPGVVEFVRGSTEPQVRVVRDELDEQLRERATALSEAERDHAQAKQVLADYKMKRDHAPPISPAATAAREALAERKIVAIPLYAAVEARGDDATTAAVEEVLTDAGILSRLVVASGDLQEALDILTRKGLGDAILIHDHSFQGNLATHLVASAHGGLAAAEIDKMLRTVPLQIDTSTRAWHMPGVSGVSSGTKTDVEFIGLLARQARRARLIKEAEELVELCWERVTVIDLQIATLKETRKVFDQRVSQAHANSSRRQFLDTARKKLQEADQAQRASQEVVRAQVGIEQRARSRQIELDETYTRIKTKEKWLPLQLTDESADRLVEALRNLQNHVADLVRKRERIIGAEDRRKSIAEVYQQTLARLGEARLERDDLETTLNVARAELEGLAKALSEQLPGFQELERQRDDVRLTLHRLNEKLVACEKAIETARTTKNVLEKQVPEKARLLEEAETAADAKRRVLREYLFTIPALEAQRMFFEAGRMTDFCGEMVSLVHEEGKQFDERTKKARGKLNTAYAEAALHFSGNGVEFDPITQIPTLLREDAPERVDIWTMSDVVDMTANSLRHDMTEEMRASIERILTNSLHGEVSSLVREVSVTQARMNDILGSIKLQRGQGNLKVEFLPRNSPIDTFQARPGTKGHEGSGRTGVEMIRFFSAGEWLLRSDREKDDVIEHLRKELEAAYALSVSGDTGDSFEEIIATRFDYRHWYTVEAYRKGANGEWENLRKAHGAGSEGMKSMDMLQPMVAGARLRLLGAEKTAPLLVGMDEVFAQLDLTHATAILQILNSFGCDWVLATEKGLHPNDVVGGAACYTVEFDNELFSLLPSIWTGHSFLTTGDIPADELVLLEGPSRGRDPDQSLMLELA